MKKLITIFTFLLFAINSNAQCTDLYISEYIEGGYLNKCLEIYNGTGADVDLGAENYQVKIYFNGSTSNAGLILLSGILKDGGVYVFCDDEADAGFLAIADFVTTDWLWNGDDAIELTHNGTTIDVFGQIGFDPGNYWGSGNDTTKDRTLIRKCSLNCPSDNNGSDTFDPSVEWDFFPKDYIDSLGMNNCGAGVSSATELRFKSIPYGCSSSNSSITIEVCATDGSGATDGSFSENITISVNSGAGNISGTLTKTASAGCAIFNDLQLDVDDFYTLRVTATGVSDAVSDLINLSNKCPGTKDTLTVMAYNLLNFPDGANFCGATTIIPDRWDTLRKITQYVEPDVMLVCELQNEAGADSILNQSLNVFGKTFYQRATFELNQSPSSGLYNMFFYNSNKLTLYDQEIIVTDVRDVNVYKAYGNDPGLDVDSDTTFFNFYAVHLKAGSASSDSLSRVLEADEIRIYIEAERNGINHILGGDLNLKRSTEGAYDILTNQGSNPLNDPINSPGDWNNSSSFAAIHTQSTRLNSDLDCGALGGMDDRFDFVLVTSNVLSGSDSVKYISGTYKALGNDGNHFNDYLYSGSNTSAPDSVIFALHNMSDHLPVIMDLEISYSDDGTAMVVNTSSEDPSCFGNCDGSAFANVYGGTSPYTFSWDDGSNQSTATASSLCAGTYHVTTRDAGASSTISTIVITDPDNLEVNASSTNISSAGANDGIATAIASGGSGSYSYSWSTGATSSSINGLPDGVYSVTVIDADNCIATDTTTIDITISGIDSLSLSNEGTSKTCPSMKDGSIVFDVTGGEPPYTYNWLGGLPDTNFLMGLYAGIYTVTISDVNDSTLIKSFAVETYPDVNADFTYEFLITDTTNLTVAFSDSSYSSTSIVSWDWNFGDGNSDQIQHAQHTYSGYGEYTVQLVVTNLYGCIDTVQYFLQVWPLAINEIGNNSVIVYPNPFSDNIKIQFQGAGNLKFYDVLGRLVLITKISGNQMVNTEKLHSGVYIIELSINDKGVYIQKVIKQ